MPSPSDTAYPMLKTTLSQKELEQCFTPSDAELNFVMRSANGRAGRLCFLVLLKSFQRLGYFLMINDAPEKLIRHIALCLKYSKLPEISDYDASGTRQRHQVLIRESMGFLQFDEEGKKTLLNAVKEAAFTKEDPADIINVGIEELARLRIELPGFSTILKMAMYARKEINSHFYSQISVELGEKGRSQIDGLFKVENSKSDWEMLKKDPGKPTVNNIRQLVAQMEWLKTWYLALTALKNLPDAKLRNFAAQAKSLDAARMSEMKSDKRYAVATCLIKIQLARRLDDLGDILVKRMQAIHSKAKEALEEYRKKHQLETEYLIGKLHDVLVAMRDNEKGVRLEAVEMAAGDDTDKSIERCEEFAAYANDNYSSFLWPFHIGHRPVLFRVLDKLRLESTSTDKGTEALIKFIAENRTSRSEFVNVADLDLSWVSEKWWMTLCPKGASSRTLVYRKHFEVCVFSHIVNELKSGDLCIRGSDRYSDYSEQLISWAEFDELAPTYCKQAGLDLFAGKSINKLLVELTAVAKTVDREFPENKSIKIENGEPVLCKVDKKQKPLQLTKLLKLIDERVEHISILDVFMDLTGGKDDGQKPDGLMASRGEAVFKALLVGGIS